MIEGNDSSSGIYSTASNRLQHKVIILAGKVKRETGKSIIQERKITFVLRRVR